MRCIHEVYLRGCKDRQQQPVATAGCCQQLRSSWQVSLCVCRDPRCCFRHVSRLCLCLLCHRVRPDPAGGSCFQSGGAATLAALLVASFVFVLLFFVMHEHAGVHRFCDTDVLKIFYVFINGLCALASVHLVCRKCPRHLPKLRQLHLLGCILQELLCVCGCPLRSRG